MSLLFANDINTIYSSKTYKGTENIEHILNTELNKIHDWLCSNRSSLNVSKTHSITFSKRGGRSVHIGSHKVEHTDCVNVRSVLVA